MQPETPTSTPQLAACVRLAQQEVARLKAECVQSGALLVDEDAIRRLAGEITGQDIAISSSRRQLRGARVRRLGITCRRILQRIRVAFHQAIKASELPGLVVGLMGGMISLFSVLGASALIGLGSITAICAGLIAFAVGACVAVLHLNPPLPGSLNSQRLAVDHEIQNHLKSLHLHREFRDRLGADLQKLKSLLPLRHKYEQERRRLASFIRELNDRRHQLLLQNWRAMRGVPFESFLREVLQMLGFDVEATKVSGDQGIDLIASRAGERLGIQVKGYDGSVGNYAVQEAFAGMSHYRCHRCAVITNSDFTNAARELALSTGCILVDQSLIPDLIAGNVFSSLVTDTPVGQA